MYSIRKNPIGIYEKALPNAFTWEEKLQAARLAGFDYMEISIDESDERLARLDWTEDGIESLRALLRREGMAMPTMCLSGHRKYPFGSKDPATRQRAMEIMEKAIILAARLGVRCIQLAAYDVYYEPGDQETDALFIEGMKQAVKMAARAGVVLAMEIMDTPYMGTITRAMEHIKKIPSPYFKIYPDIGNLSNFAQDVPQELALGLGEIVAIHVKETKPGVFRDLDFGEGAVDFLGIFKALHALDYQGMFLLEMWADNTRPQTVQEAADKIASARAFVTDKMKQAGMVL